jgi:hypothetical protein
MWIKRQAGYKCGVINSKTVGVISFSIHNPPIYDLK